MRLPPLAWLAVAFTSGVALAGRLPAAPVWPVAVAVALVGLALAGYRRAGAGGPVGIVTALLAATALAGLAYAGARGRLPHDAVAGLAGGPPAYRPVPVGVAGVVRAEVTGDLPRRFLLQVERAAGRSASGLVLVSQGAERHADAGGAARRGGAGGAELGGTSQGGAVSAQGAPPLHYGQRVEVDGQLVLPQPAGNPGQFDYANYLHSQGVQAILAAREIRITGRLPFWRRWPGVFPALRMRLEAVLRRAFPKGQAALLAGLLFGTRADLPEQLTEDFRVAGIYHVLAVSGSNVAFVALPILGVLTRALGRRRGLVGTIPVVLGFVLLTGASASVLRAGTMAVLVLLGEAIGRPGGGLPALSAAVLALLLLNPATLGDPGFQLSVAATAGILLLTRPIAAGLSALPPWLKAPLAVTLAAQAAVLPLSLLYWNGFSLVALLANLIAAPLVEALVLLGSLTVATGLVLPVLAHLGAWPTGLLLRLFTGSTHLLAAAPLAFVYLPAPQPWETVGFYLALTLAVAPRLLRRRLLMGVLIFGLIVLRLIPAPPRLEATFLDVGQGDATLLQLPGGRVMLVDGGGHQDGIEVGGRDPGLEVVVPYLQRLGIRRLDYVVATHPHADHVAGLIAVMQALPVGEVWYSGQESGLPAYQSFLHAATAAGAPLRRVRRGERFALGPGVDVSVLGPPDPFYTGQRSDENANSVILQVTYGRTRLLLVGDAEAPVEEDLLRSGAMGVQPAVTVLKVGHHGSRYASSAPWLAALRPAVAVISVGARNLFGHPAEETLDRLSRASGLVLRTDRDGAVLLRSDGEQVLVRTVRSRGRWVVAERRIPALGDASVTHTPEPLAAQAGLFSSVPDSYRLFLSRPSLHPESASARPGGTGRPQPPPRGARPPPRPPLAADPAAAW